MFLREIFFMDKLDDISKQAVRPLREGEKVWPEESLKQAEHIINSAALNAKNPMKSKEDIEELHNKMLADLKNIQKEVEGDNSLVLINALDTYIKRQKVLAHATSELSGPVVEQLGAMFEQPMTPAQEISHAGQNVATALRFLHLEPERRQKILQDENSPFSAEDKRIFSQLDSLVKERSKSPEELRKSAFDILGIVQPQ